MGLKRAAPALIAVSLVCAAAGAQDRPPLNHALVIGINKSGTPIQGVPTLHYAVDDAQAVGDLLEGAGYEVVKLTDAVARRENIVSELQRLAHTTQEQDSVFIYFAGHGVRQKVGAREHSYWLTYDATLSRLEINGVRLTHLLDYVNDIPARRKLLILDHCHSGEVDFGDAVLEGARDGRGVVSVSSQSLFSPEEFRSQVESVVTEGLLVLGAATDKAYELADLGHGILTYVLIEAMTTSKADTDDDDKLSLAELKTYMLPRIDELADRNRVFQTPIVVERGTNLNWQLAGLSAGLDDLKPLIGQLEALGNLDFEIALRCYAAIDSAGHGTASDDDELIIARLKRIAEMPSGQWDTKSDMVKNFVQALTGSP